MMKIRLAKEKDCEKILELLSQVLELHAKIRPDIFLSGTTKYTKDQLLLMMKEESRYIYVAEDVAEEEEEERSVCGYVFCELEEAVISENMVPFRTMYIDDLCIDEKKRGCHVGQALFEHVKQEAKKLGCYEVTLHVWEGNDSAKGFYEKMGMKTKKTMMEIIL